MRIVRIKSEKDLSDIRENRVFSKHGSVVALGFFDGVHLAHRALIKRAEDIARQRGLELVIFTFSGDDQLI